MLTHMNFGDEFILRERYDSAQVHLLKAREYTSDLDYSSTPYDKALIEGNLGIVNKAIGDIDLAQLELEEAAKFFVEDQDYSAAAIFMIHLADVYVAQGKIDQARAAAEESLKLAKSQDLLGEIRDANKKLAEIFVIQDEYELAYTHQQAYNMYRDSINNEEVIRTIANQRTEYEVGLKQAEVDIANLRNQNQEYWVIGLVVFAVMLVVFLVLIYRNNLIKQRINLELANQKAALEKLNNTKDKFFSIISHDIRGPVSSFHGVSRIIKYAVNSKHTDQLLEIAEEIDKSTDQMSALLDNLLKWATQQQDHITIVPEKLSANELIKSAGEMFLNMAKSKNIELNFETQSDVSLWADQNTTHTILRNLINNAIKFTPESGNVTVSLTTRDDQAVISVKDTGIGIDKDELSDLFELKAQKSKFGTSGEKGLGLGLQLVKEFAGMNNGRIEVESSVDAGSTFSIYIPLYDVENTLA